MTGSEPLIEPGFLFSQHSLNTYVQCPRRFLLKYVDRQPWPAAEGDTPLEYEQHLARGRVFHQWLVREQLGVDMTDLVAACGDELLLRWWQAARDIDWNGLPAGIRQPELAVVVPLGDYRLYARYDLVAWSEADGAVIVDWKTLPVRLSDRTLHERVQTRVYLYTLVAGGQVALGCPPLDPESVAMRYWFAEFPDSPGEIRYSLTEYAGDRKRLSDLAQVIAHQPRDAFVRTTRQGLCTQCNYRGLCWSEKVSKAHDDFGWLDEDLDFALDVSEVPELDY